MQCGESSNIFGEEMYGGRKQKYTHMAVMMQQLINDNIFLQRFLVFVTHLDASQCYDRILTALEPYHSEEWVYRYR